LTLVPCDDGLHCWSRRKKQRMSKVERVGRGSRGGRAQCLPWSCQAAPCVTVPGVGGPAAPHDEVTGVLLAKRDHATRAAIAAVQDTLDARAMTAVWDAALRAPAWDRAPVWFHGDRPERLYVLCGHQPARRREHPPPDQSGAYRPCPDNLRIELQAQTGDVQVADVSLARLTSQPAGPRLFDLGGQPVVAPGCVTLPASRRLRFGIL
jgi:hypothetical protein